MRKPRKCRRHGEYPEAGCVRCVAYFDWCIEFMRAHERGEPTSVLHCAAEYALRYVADDYVQGKGLDRKVDGALRIAALRYARHDVFGARGTPL